MSETYNVYTDGTYYYINYNNTYYRLTDSDIEDFINTNNNMTLTTDSTFSGYTVYSGDVSLLHQLTKSEFDIIEYNKSVVKGTLAKKVGNNITIIYPKTSVDMVVIDQSTGETLDMTLGDIEDDLNDLEDSYGLLVTLANDIDTSEDYNVYIYNDDEDNGYFISLNNNYYAITFDSSDLIINNSTGEVSISGADISTLAARPSYSSSNDSDMSYDWGGR